MADNDMHSSSPAPAIDFEMLNKFETMFPKVGKCPVCEHRKWFVMQDDMGSTGVIPVMTVNGDMLQNGQRMAVLSCQQCGYVQIYDLAILKKYLGSE